MHFVMLEGLAPLEAYLYVKPEGGRPDHRNCASWLFPPLQLSETLIELSALQFWSYSEMKKAKRKASGRSKQKPLFSQNVCT